LLLEEFGFHPLTVEDVARGHQRPKVEEYPGYLFAVTYGVVSGQTAGGVVLAEVMLFIGRNYLVTIHRGRVTAIEDAMARWTRGGPLLQEGVGFLVYTVMDTIIDSYFPAIDAIEDQVEDLEEETLGGAPTAGVERLLKFKRTLFVLRRVLYPLRDVFHVFLRRDKPIFSANTLAYFQDVYDHVLRLLDVLDMEREMLAAALDAHLAVVSNRLNTTMRTLTAITVAVALIGSVFGAWGMNFEQVPLENSPWGFWAVACGAVLLVVTALTYSWKRGWL
jgi:magnesium transporter